MDNVVLSTGSHATREAGVCVMELVAWFAGERHSDKPQCACPVIASFARQLNDNLTDEYRQRLKPLIPALALSRAEWPVPLKRAFIAADYAVRVFAPIALEARGRTKDAARLRGLAEIVDWPSALKANTAYAYAYAAAAAVAAAAYAYADADAAVSAATRSRLADLGIECLEKMLTVTA